MIEIAIKRLTETAQLPVFAHPTDACADLVADENTTLESQERQLISTGVAFNLETGWEAQIRSRSGLAYKKGLTVLNSPGTIDADYRGEVGVILYNSSDEVFEIKRGDRIAQVAFRKIPQVQLREITELRETGRGAGGFGSTCVSSS